VARLPTDHQRPPLTQSNLYRLGCRRCVPTIPPSQRMEAPEITLCDRGVGEWNQEEWALVALPPPRSAVGWPRPLWTPTPVRSFWAFQIPMRASRAHAGRPLSGRPITCHSEHGSEELHLRCHVVYDNSRRYRVETVTGLFAATLDDPTVASNRGSCESVVRFPRPQDRRWW
jgi:hypothetical protein